MAITTAQISTEESIDQQLKDYTFEAETSFQQSSKDGIERLFRHVTPKQLVDLGCGDGAAYKFVGKVPYIGVDINKEQLKKHPGKTVCDDMVSYLKKQKNGSIPAIFCHHALEHVPNPADILNLIGQKLSKGGYAYIEVPADDRVHSVHHATFDSPEDLLPADCEVVEAITSGGEHYIIARKL